MKLSNMIMILIIIQATIMFYDGIMISGDPYLRGYGDNETLIWDFVANPSSWTGTSFLAFFAVLIGIGGAIAIGTYLYTKSDTVLFFGVFTMLLAAGAIPILSLYNVFTRNSAMFGCATADCTTAILAWVFTGGLIAIFYVLSVLEWWSGRSMSSG